MATAYTPGLGLALPVTGELSGTWGDVVNDSITSLIDSAISGTTSITVDADITLTTTTGAANESRQAIILWSPATGTVTRNITAPAKSKIYTVINASGGTQSIVFRGAGPTTGVTIVKGESAVVAWNGTDFTKVSNTAGSGSFTNLSVSGTATLSGTTTLPNLTASTALALDSSKNVVSVTNTGTGNNVLAASPTLSGTVNVSGLVAVTGNSIFSSTGALTISKGNTSERPTAVSGMLRFNTQTSEFEGYNGAAWASVGGAALSNDTSTLTNVFPLFASATSGTASTLFTSNAQYLFKPSTGELSVKAPRASNGIVVNSATVTSDYTIATGDNGMSAGPVTVASGITVIVSSGSIWTVV
jgi:hypothetical protein